MKALESVAELVAALLLYVGYIAVWYRCHGALRRRPWFRLCRWRLSRVYWWQRYRLGIRGMSLRLRWWRWRGCQLHLPLSAPRTEQRYRLEHRLREDRGMNYGAVPAWSRRPFYRGPRR